MVVVIVYVNVHVIVSVDVIVVVIVVVIMACLIVMAKRVVPCSIDIIEIALLSGDNTTTTAIVIVMNAADNATNLLRRDSFLSPCPHEL